MIELKELITIFVLVLFVSYWWRAKGVKEVALTAVRNYCKQMDIDMLDEFVMLRALWFKRNDKGEWCIWRSYNFEFSTTGEDRYMGKIVMLGNKVQNVEVEPHRI